jgi:hypothetical protein
MNWEAIGAVGEVLGALGVIATLGYLAVQIRQNTRSVRAATYQEIVSHAAEMNTSLYGEGAVAEIVLKGRADQSTLSEVERFRFQILVYQVFQSFETIFLLDRDGNLDDAFVKSKLNVLHRWLSQPGIRSVWSERREELHPEFVAFVERTILS